MVSGLFLDMYSGNLTSPHIMCRRGSSKKHSASDEIRQGDEGQELE